MFESFKTICYVPLIVFALGWGLAQIMYFAWKKELPADGYNDQLLSSTLRGISNILLAGAGNVVMLLAGIYLGRYARWLMLGMCLVLIMLNVARLGAAIQFSMEKLAGTRYHIFRMMVLPYAVRLACYLIGACWMVYVFVIAGLF